MVPKKRSSNGIKNVNNFNMKRTNDSQSAILRELLSTGIHVIDGEFSDEQTCSKIRKVALEVEENMTTAYQNRDPRVTVIFEESDRNGQNITKNADRLSCKASGKYILF